MDTENAIRGILFLHIILMAWIGNKHLKRAQTSDDRKRVAKIGVIYWLVSLVAIVFGMILTAFITAIFLTRTMSNPDTLLIWGLEGLVAVILAGVSAWLLNRRLSPVGTDTDQT